MSYQYPAGEVQAICTEVNQDHPERSVAIVCHALGRADVTAALLTGYGPDGLAFEVQGPAAAEAPAVVIPWDRPIEDRDDVRHSIAALYALATDQGSD